LANKIGTTSDGLDRTEQGGAVLLT
jgi:hypothetical protein